MVAVQTATMPSLERAVMVRYAVGSPLLELKVMSPAACAYKDGILEAPQNPLAARECRHRLQ